MKLDILFSHWNQIRAGLLATIDKFSEDELNFAPFESSWTAGQIMLHIANAEEGWFRFAVHRPDLQKHVSAFIARIAFRCEAPGLKTNHHRIHLYPITI